MIEITKEALFDLLNNKTTLFRWDYKDIIIKIDLKQSYKYSEDFYQIFISITKNDVISLLLNRFIDLDEFSLKIEL